MGGSICPCSKAAETGDVLDQQPGPPPGQDRAMVVPEPVAAATSQAVQIHSGFTEHTYRLVFPFEERFAPNAPHLQTILPSGIIENDKVLEPQKEKGLITFAYPQSIPDETAELPTTKPQDGKPDSGEGCKLRDTAFVWRREDGTNALVQTWATNINEQFRKDFEISEGTNPDSTKFLPQAELEFREAMEQLFGPAARSCPLWFCHKKLISESPAVVGFSEDVLAHVSKHPELMRELAIASVDSEGLGFVADGTNGKGEKYEKPFRLTPGEKCVLYRKTGWDTLGSSKPLNQFLQDANLHELRTLETSEKLATTVVEETGHLSVPPPEVLPLPKLPPAEECLLAKACEEARQAVINLENADGGASARSAAWTACEEAWARALAASTANETQRYSSVPDPPLSKA